MQTLRPIRRGYSLCAAVVLAAGLVAAQAPGLAHPQQHSQAAVHQADPANMTTQFAGVKANTGTVTHSKQGKLNVLTLSDDFVIPDSPAPHWQVVDSKGNTYLLQRLKIKGDKFNKQIILPTYIHDIAKVQIWCAWAEVLLGEASFPAPVK